MTHATTPQTQTAEARTRPGSPAETSHDAVDCERKLRLVLRVNATTSTISGLAMAAAPDVVDELLGTGHAGWIRIVGFALVVFAAFVAWLSTADRRVLQMYTPGIIAGDVSWVIASVLTVLLGWYSGTGIVVVLAMASAVDVFAFLQFRSARHLRRG